MRKKDIKELREEFYSKYPKLKDPNSLWRNITPLHNHHLTPEHKKFEYDTAINFFRNDIRK